MPSVKDNIKNKLSSIEEKLASSLGTTLENELTEQAYWLEQAWRSEKSKEMLDHAFTLNKKTNGTRGLPPNILTEDAKEKHKQEQQSASPAVKAGDSLWGVLYREFTSGEHLDDPHFADVFRRLPASAQSHFVDAVEDYITSIITEEKRTKRDENTFSISDIEKLPIGVSLNLDSVLRNEELLLHLIAKAKEIASVKEEIIQQYGKKAADWIQYHQTEPRTEAKFEEILFGPEAAKTHMRIPPDEIQVIISKTKHDTLVTPHEEDMLAEFLPPYERKIRDRFTMSVSEYVRIRSVIIEQLLNAIPVDEKQLAFIAKSAVRLELLDVPEEEFYKRVRVSQLIRAYAFEKDLRNVTVRQFFRGVVENK